MTEIKTRLRGEKFILKMEEGIRNLHSAGKKNFKQAKKSHKKVDLTIERVVEQIGPAIAVILMAWIGTFFAFENFHTVTQNLLLASFGLYVVSAVSIYVLGGLKTFYLAAVSGLFFTLCGLLIAVWYVFGEFAYRFPTKVKEG